MFHRLFPTVACLAIVFFVPRLVAQPAPPDYPPLNAKATADFDRTWARYQKRAPDSGSRDIYTFLLNAVALNWRPEKWSAVIDLAEELHDRDPDSLTYGNYRWYWSDPHPNDRNAVEFCMQTASLTWMLYRDRLPGDARAKLAAALALGSEGMLRHKVAVSYTNIFLMRLANCILIGESTGQPDLVKRGRAWLDEWLAYTRDNGIHEFSSPTYYGIDVEDLGALARYAQDPDVQTKAEAALRLFWTDIAANWFTSYQGIAGAHSRDYGFLTGHGLLDQQLFRAHWLAENPGGESRPVLDDLASWAPPADLRATVDDPPRRVSQQWGPQPWERATHYIGRSFSLGTAGESYGAQDKVLALTLAGGPQMPIVNFSLDYRGDPYGQSKIAEASGHIKLMHLVPFVASVQRGPEALLVAVYDPAYAINPAGKSQPMHYAGVGATFVLPSGVELWDARGPLAADATEQALAGDSPLFLRYGNTAAMLRFVFTRDDRSRPAKIMLVRDGLAVGAQRLTAVLAGSAPRGRVIAAVWVRATEGLANDAAFTAFRRDGLEAVAHSAATVDGDRLDIAVPGLSAPLKLSIDLHKDKRLAVEGADPAMEHGILNVNGRDIGTPCLTSR
ncbi:MAG TPA: hypothetical protein VNU49_04575 [Opitutaceae bacterium]|jgi:hypothetical protein|nr:hypothetical protein [Opitutaceae bacterium]